jgi:hypothetical protein
MRFIPNSITRTIARQILVTQKNSPHILFGVGILGVVGSTVLACRSTLKLEETVDEVKQDLESLKIKVPVEDNRNGNRYTEQDYYRDLGYTYGRCANKFVRLYGPSIVLGGISIAALTKSHTDLTRRNAALTATLVAVSRAYEEYRVRVQDELGKDRELEIYRGIQEKQAEIDGKKQTVKVIKDPNGFSVYARVFDETCVNYVKNSELNRYFIQCQQNYANERLRARGHLFLNEVYESLGFDHSRAGSVVGWIMGGDGDNHVDFGLFEATSARFVNNLEPSIILDFNVDGVIFDKIQE